MGYLTLISINNCGARISDCDRDSPTRQKSQHFHEPYRHIWPAGPAGAGYAWLSQYDFFSRLEFKWCWFGLIFGIMMELIFGIGQQLHGAHFLPHDLWTLIICWSIALLTFQLVYRERNISLKQIDVTNERLPNNKRDRYAE